MTIDPITAVSASLPAMSPAQPATGVDTHGFTAWLDQHLATANTQLIQADDGLRKLALGEADNLHQVMVNLEKAKLSFELIVQVRNKILDAYQELMRMQI